MFEIPSVLGKPERSLCLDPHTASSIEGGHRFLLDDACDQRGKAHEVTIQTMLEATFAPSANGGTIKLRDANDEWIASLTLGASTVLLTGPRRTFAEETAAHPIDHSIWVRTLPAPFDGVVNLEWLCRALAANNQKVPDVLALAMQYIRGAPAIYDGNMQIAGEAKYGPLKKGERKEGSDFNDYLGLTWNYAEGLTDHPERQQFRCLDCSGFMRMIWGYRHAMSGFGPADRIPLCFEPIEDRTAMPRRANEIYEFGPGVIVIENSGRRVKDRSALAIGDLVFFDANSKDGPRLDHLGMYFGLDGGGNARFISSRKTRNGPTIGDVAGASILNGTELYARSFRSARRL